ncbi:MAG: hypothetical protein V1721_04160 [Pseudomonadota bacterium]
MTFLLTPDQPCPLEVNLKLIAEMEGSYGSLYQIAERLLDKSLPVSSMIGVIKMLYRHAGCGIPDEALDDFLLRQPCTELLTSVLLDILEPIEGGMMPEPLPPSAQFLAGMIKKFPDSKKETGA